MSVERVSIIFRALNEEKWFTDALEACRALQTDELDVEIILVDSGSTDATLDIAQRFGCRIVHIKKADFTFGRSLNYGCEAASGDYLVFISAHCIPAHKNWLTNLIAPLQDGTADYAYGRQIGHDVSRFSEHQIFAQYFPAYDKLPQDDGFINNANSAIRRSVWEKHKFDEAVTGLEDMVLGQQVRNDGGQIGYVADAPVVHIHEETFSQTRRRYYREALTLRQIMPDMHFHLGDLVRYLFVAWLNDTSVALQKRRLIRSLPEIFMFRLMQYWGTYRGHNEHKALSRAQKERYYYPKAERRPARPAASADKAPTRASANPTPPGNPK